MSENPIPLTDLVIGGYYRCMSRNLRRAVYAGAPPGAFVGLRTKGDDVFLETEYHIEGPWGCIGGVRPYELLGECPLEFLDAYYPRAVVTEADVETLTSMWLVWHKEVPERLVAWWQSLVGREWCRPNYALKFWLEEQEQ